MDVVLTENERETLERLRGSQCLSHLLCELWLLLVEPDFDELDWREPPVCAVRPVQVVVDPPVFKEDPGFEQGLEELTVQVLVS